MKFTGRALCGGCGKSGTPGALGAIQQLHTVDESDCVRAGWAGEVNRKRPQTVCRTYDGYSCANMGLFSPFSTISDLHAGVVDEFGDFHGRHGLVLLCEGRRRKLLVLGVCSRSSARNARCSARQHGQELRVSAR